jgi:glyoxylase-like metal-dependent hydrolase (beta-lactamase superfamily II)
MVHVVDLAFLGRSQTIATGVLEGPGGLVLVDPGPASTLEGLQRGLTDLGYDLDAVCALLVTHIHLDHSGAVGAIVRRCPRVRVCVHERGAPHLIDPGKLVQSASRLYGDSMGRLWGEVAPVPAERVEALGGGETLRLAGRVVQVADTPGHASHHLAYFDEASETAFIGDTGGIRIGSPLCVVPPTPPPDINLEAWYASLDRIRGWRPRQIFITHFGPFTDTDAHLADLERRLREYAELVRSLLADPSMDDGGRQARFVERALERLGDQLGDAGALERYKVAVPFDHCWHGLARYWRKR